MAKKNIIEMDKNHRISVVKIDENEYNIAVLYNSWPDCPVAGLHDWEVDYSKFDDTLSASSEMEVYGVIKHQIEPAYIAETGFTF